MTLAESLNLAALVVIPIVAVVIGKWLQDRSEKRKDKMQIFKALMTSRIYGWTPDSVNALNIIDVVFADDKEVRAAWKDLNEKYRVTNPDEQHLKKIEIAQYKLLETISNSLGYKDKISWETIQNPYIPVGMKMEIDKQRNAQQEYVNALISMNKIINNQGQNSSSRSNTLASANGGKEDE